MDFKTYLTETAKAKYKMPNGYADDESMMDDFYNELEQEELVYDRDFTMKGNLIYFNKPVTKEVASILNSLNFKKK